MPWQTLSESCLGYPSLLKRSLAVGQGRRRCGSSHKMRGPHNAPLLRQQQGSELAHGLPRQRGLALVRWRQSPRRLNVRLALRHLLRPTIRA